MTIPKIAAMLSLASALSLAFYEPAQSAELTSRFEVATRGAEQTQVVQVRWRRGWRNGAAAPPSYYGGTYLGYPYGVFPAVYGYVFPFGYGYRPYGWIRPY
jgi:hypothetical protein